MLTTRVTVAPEMCWNLCPECWRTFTAWVRGEKTITLQLPKLERVRDRECSRRLSTAHLALVEARAFADGAGRTELYDQLDLLADGVYNVRMRVS